MAVVPNTIKVKQIDNDDLTQFILALLGAYTGDNGIVHNWDEIFEGGISTNGPFVDSGNMYVSGYTLFHSGFTTNSGIYVNGNISGQSITVQNFSVPSGTFQTINIGSLKITGVPIYGTGDIGAAVLLPSGTVYGYQQIANAPTWEKDASGYYMPATGIGVPYITLCVSIGS